jgi:hypothetical protein
MCLQEVTPEWMLPSKCFDDALRLNPARSAEPDINDFSDICKAATVNSPDPECRNVTAQQPRYSCSFKSLSSFWQVRQCTHRCYFAVRMVAGMLFMLGNSCASQLLVV